MSEGVPEGASLPEGIDVDDAAAYFGVTKSSDVLQQLMEMDSKQALSKTLEHLSDVILQPGEFNFEAASERLQCEGGEIYFLIFGHLNLMSLPDPMLVFAGQQDSTGATNSAHPLATEEVIESISVLFDPMQFLKILAIGYSTGGESEVNRYLSSIQDMMANPSANLEKIQTLASESTSSLDVAGHALPIALLASPGAEPATLEAGLAMPVQEKKTEPVSKPETPAPVEQQSPEEPVSVPLPTSESVPLPKTVEAEKPSTSVPLPSVETSVAMEESPKNDIEADLATQDAFSGAFGTQLIPEAEEVIQQPVVEEVIVEEPIVEEPIVEESEEEWVSDAERFIAADVDESGALSVEELAVAANLPIDAAEELHKAADADGDGEVTLSEFVSSEAAQTMSSLPRPVAPVRRPIQKQQPAAPSPGIQAPQAGWQQQPVQPVQPVQQQPLQQQPIHQQPMQQQPMQQQPGMNIQPTIRSGIHCRGCGIGLDPYWRFCPICGNMNTSAHR
jgi:hypothetical protein